MATVQALVEFALREIGVSSIPSSVTATTSDAQQCLAFVYAEARFLRSQKFFPQCKKTYEFNLVNGRTKYPLPQDFYQPLTGTLWDNTNRWQLLGPLSDADFRYRQLGYVSFQNRRAFRVIGSDGNPTTIGGQFEIDPAPGAADTATLSYEYIYKTMFIPPYWSASTAYTLGQYRSSNGNIYLCDTSGTSGANQLTGTGTNIADGTARWDYVSTPYETVLSDSDLCIFDDDVMISGIQWRYKLAKGLPVGDFNPAIGIPTLHKKLVENAVGRWGGDRRISLVYPQVSVSMPNVADGGWVI